MNQKFVYHPLNRTNAPRARVASAKLVVSEYLAYVTMLSAVVVIAIITFAYAANITVQPGIFSSEVQPVAHVERNSRWLCPKRTEFSSRSSCRPRVSPETLIGFLFHVIPAQAGIQSNTLPAPGMTFVGQSVMLAADL